VREERERAVGLAQGLVPQLTAQLFARLQQQQGGGGQSAWKVALSYWELRQNQVVDLMRVEPHAVEVLPRALGLLRWTGRCGC
jgi:hypothetical protein